MELITNALKVFDHLDAVDLAPDSLTKYQVNLLPQSWLYALTKQQRIAEQIRLLYINERGSLSFVKTLTEHVNALRVVFDKDIKKCLGMAYVFEFPSEPRQMSFLFAACPPDSNEFVKLETLLGGTLPLDLKQFLSLHDGLSVEGNFGVGFYPLRKIIRLDNLDSNSEINPIYGNEICFAGDGLGNQFCMRLSAESNTVLDWDHEDQSLKMLGTFWEIGTKIVRDLMYLD